MEEKIKGLGGFPLGNLASIFHAVIKGPFPLQLKGYTESSQQMGVTVLCEPGTVLASGATEGTAQTGSKFTAQQWRHLWGCKLQGSRIKLDGDTERALYLLWANYNYFPFS